MTIAKRLSPSSAIIATGAAICVFLSVQFFPTAELYDTLIYNQSNKAHVISDELNLNLSSNALGSNAMNPNASLVGNDDGEKILNFLRINLGFSDFGAFAVMGNWGQESGLDPTTVEGCYKNNHTECKELDAKLRSGSMTMDQWMNYKDLYPGREIKYGYGLAQWTYPSRQENLWKFAESRGTYVGDLETQLLFFVEEWKSYDASGAITERLKKASSEKEMYELVAVFEKTYEGSADADMTMRNNHAKNAYEKYKNCARPSSTSTKSASTAATNTSGADWQKWIIDNAKNYTGKPYNYGGNDLDNGIDCSHFVFRILADAGAVPSGTYYASSEIGKSGYPTVSLDQAQTGDIVWWNGHLALYLGDYDGKKDQVIDAKDYGIPSRIEDLTAAHKGSYKIYRPKS